MPLINTDEKKYRVDAAGRHEGGFMNQYLTDDREEALEAAKTFVRKGSPSATVYERVAVVAPQLEVIEVK